MFKVKKIEINAAHEKIAILVNKDAYHLSLNATERIRIINPKNNKSIICSLEILDYRIGSHSGCILNEGEIGVFGNAFENLEIRENKNVQIIPASKPQSIEYVKKKFLGGKLKEKELEEIIRDIIENHYSEVETTYFILACTTHPLDDNETIYLTRAMINAGKILDFKTGENKIIVDKHCIGGIPGNRTSMIVIPIIAAAGLIIPKSSSRAITSPSGTADTMEVLANVNVLLSDMHHEVTKLNGCIVWGGALDLSPADDIIIQVEHPLEIDSEGQMIASILSKKKSVGSTHVLIDIPVGPTAKIKNIAYAHKLSNRFIKVGKAVGLEIKTIITDGSEPIGNGIGPLYEANDVMSVLRNEPDAPQDLKEKSLMMAGLILEMGNIAKKNNGYKLAKIFLESGMAYEKMEQIIEFQGRNNETPKAKHKHQIKSSQDCKLKSFDNKKISKLAYILGAPSDKAAGLILHKKVDDKIKTGDLIIEFFSNSKIKLQYAISYLHENKIYDIE